jgi:fluoroacetyl-CoA thioesterase
VTLIIGLSARISTTVTDADTALALRSGDVPVLGTPRVLALAEQAAVAALDGHLPPDDTSVGVAVALRHLRPARVGAPVTAEAELVAVDGRELGFRIEVRSGDDLLATADHQRAVVPRSRFA